ncbi:protein FAR1-RELATED SEQUENCE 5-like [Nicotiana tabacum]|uniref:Protein FAR1-RELATED SEQUENCE 5-like n=1 Tax=Nicotiana tabacum TaxID=4097 RepID=A0AC58TH00_TOBAC
MGGKASKTIYTDQAPAIASAIKEVFPNIKSTQRSESTNKVFTEMACKTMTLTEFVNHYEQRAAEMRDIEATEDFKCRGTPKLAIEDCGILKHAASIYTRTIFTRFQHEFLQETSKKVIKLESNGTCHTYTVLKGEGGQTDTVQFNSFDNFISCSCLMFESLGWLCCHALKVLFFDLDFSYIHVQYILKRWTKNTKQGNGFDEYNNKKKLPTLSMAIRLNGLMKESFAVMTLAANDAESEEIARKFLYQARVEITKFQNELYAEGTRKNYYKFSTTTSFSGTNDRVFDPIKKKGKEMDMED